MDNWFAATSPSVFVPFTISHLLMLGAAIGGFVFLLAGKVRIRKSPLFFSRVRWTLFTLLLVSEISYQAWAISNGVWSFSGHVPLHLCGIASITAMIGLLTLRPLWIQISFFIGILPAVLTLITPELPHDFQHYRFWKFFIHHMAIPWACLFLALRKPAVISLRSLFLVYVLLVGYALLIGFLVNPAAGANYLYLTRLPDAATPLSFFGSGIWYYLNLGIVAFLLFGGQYLLWKKFFLHKGKEGAH